MSDDGLLAELSDVQSAPWRETLTDPGTNDWREHWVLDGERVTVRNTPRGMVFAAGPVPGDHASHAVLWTKRSFEGDVRIAFDFQRLDTINRFVNILYIQATGTGQSPYDRDIHAWSALRDVPYMNTYFSHMNLLHISYAAFGNADDKPEDYVRARRYPVGNGRSFDDIAVPPDYADTGLFAPGAWYHVQVVKQGNMVLMHVRGESKERVFQWDLSAFPPLAAGPIGIRHMASRCSRYANITISTIE